MPIGSASSGQSADSQDKDGDAPWTFVSAKGSRRRNRLTAEAAIDFHGPLTAPGAGSSAASDAAPTAAKLPATPAALAHIRTEHARVSARWRELPSCRRLRALVSAHAPGHAAVTQAVCLGAGSFGGPLDGGESVRRAHVQTVAFLLLADLLGQHSGEPVPCFFQEPLYTDADKAYLRSLGHSVVEAPAASQMITETTLVFSIHLPTRDYLDSLAGALPAILIGTAFRRYEELPQFSGAEASRLLDNLQRVHREYHGFEFPREKHDHCFSDTFIYWRPAAADAPATHTSLTVP